jgi:hypothetical protein
MTGPQKKWLDANRPYRPLGQPPGAGAAYVKVGILHEDGAFELKQRGGRPNVRPGSFEVGILELRDRS